MLFWILLLGAVIFGLGYVFQQNAERIENLPLGWSKEWNPQSGEVYYYDHKTKLSHLHNPDKNLPLHWHTTEHDDGRTYYQNSETHATQFDRPT